MSKESPKNKSKIKSKIREVAEKHNLTSSYYLQKFLDVAPTVAVNLWNDDVTRFSVEILELLCEKFNCEVGELLVYAPNVKRSKSVVAPESVKAESVKETTEKTVKSGSGNTFNNSILDIVNSASDNESLLSTVEAAERLNVSRKSVNDYIADGKLRAVKNVPGQNSTHNFILESDLIEFMSKK